MAPPPPPPPTSTATETYTGYGNSPKSAPAKKKNNFVGTGKSLVGDFAWNDVLIPETAGYGAVKLYYQRRTFVQYSVIAAAATYAFKSEQLKEHTALRAAILGLIFPGAGLTAVATIPSLLAWVVGTALIPVVLFFWFGCGGIAFPMGLWLGTAGIAAALARDTLFEPAGSIWPVICIGGLTYVYFQTKAGLASRVARREVRNNYLVESLQQNQSNALKTIPAPGSRELDLRTLRFVQWFIELGLSPEITDEYFTIIDQFQTSAIRYQLYEAVYALGLYQCHYTPNFHSYLSRAQRGAIDKSCTEKVMSYWKYESMLGKFDFTDWNPIKKDNIMVTGYVLQAIGIYESNTGDQFYRQPGSLEFVVSEQAKFRSDFKEIAEAVYDNMNTNAYCLYPCEPNWLYTPCNLVGIGGIVISDRVLGLGHGVDLKDRFLRAMEEEFTEPDGSILPIRSELTGYTIPGLCGVLTDCVNSILCAAYLPAIAHRNWTISKKESVRYDKDGKLEIVGLTGADLIDPGNYKPGTGACRAYFANASAEYGDRDINRQCLEQLDNIYYPVITTPSGSLKNEGMSTNLQGCALKARISQYQDWTSMMQVGPAESTKKGPLLADAPFPEVLIAKAYSHDGLGMDLVVYDGKKPGTFELGFERLIAGKNYAVGENATMVADMSGKATVKVTVSGRTDLSVKAL